MTTEYDPNAWLNQFNPSLKSKLAHIFLRIIREGETEIEVILDAAFTVCCEPESVMDDVRHLANRQEEW